MGPGSSVTFNGMSGGTNGKLARTEKSQDRKMTNSMYAGQNNQKEIQRDL
jgi:hypothetical protein